MDHSKVQCSKKSKKIKVYICKSKPVEICLPDDTFEITTITKCDAILCYGGDGAIIKYFRKISESFRLAQEAGLPIDSFETILNKPVFGINRGTVGFVSNDLSDKVAHKVIRRILQLPKEKRNRFIKHTNLLKVEISGQSILALNEVAIVSKAYGRLIKCTVNLKCSTGKNKKIHYSSDGLLISTATGSTAWNSSAGGPLLLPELEANVITPISPFSLSSRPLVLPLEYRFEITPNYPAVVIVDGRELFYINNSSTLKVESYHQTARIIRVFGFFDAIQSKMKWNYNIKS